MGEGKCGIKAGIINTKVSARQTPPRVSIPGSSVGG